MFGYVGNGESDVAELRAGLKQACANDPSLSAVAAGCSAHNSGWGYVISADNGLFHYRTELPVFEDRHVLPRLEGGIYAIFHGRFATDPELAGPIFSHPFVAATPSETLFLAHNGSVDAPNLAERNVDSEWALEQVVRAGSLERALPLLKQHTRFGAESFGDAHQSRPRQPRSNPVRQLLRLQGAAKN